MRNAQQRVTAFRIYYSDGEIIEGTAHRDWVHAPMREVEALEVFYDEWDKDNNPISEIITANDIIKLPNSEHGKPASKPKRGLTTKIKKSNKPDIINYANKEGDIYIPPTDTMKGM